MFKKITAIAFTLIAAISTVFAADDVLTSKKYVNFTADEITTIKAYNTDHKLDYKKFAVAFQEAKTKNKEVASNPTLYTALVKEQKKAGLIFGEAGMALCLRSELSEDLLAKLYADNAVLKTGVGARWAIDFPFFCPELAIKAMDNNPAKVFDLMAEKVSNVIECNRALSWAEKHCVDASPASMAQSLRKIKRINYRKIAESDDWKTQMVRIELMLKSME